MQPPKEVRALSVKAPWADLIASGDKTVEVRSWHTHYRGPLVICSGATPDIGGAARKYKRHIGALGVTRCLVHLLDVRGPKPGDATRALVAPGHNFCWVLELTRTLPPVAVKGRLGLFTLPEVCVAQLLSERAL
jgi:hypothetical protein